MPSETSIPHAKGLGSIVIALLAFFTLADLFAAQAILPILAKMYHASPAQVGIAVNASTAGMAIGALVTAIVGSRLDRRRGIVVSLLVLTIPSVLLAFAPNLLIFASLRAAQGLCMACAFTLTLSYLGETSAPERQAGAFAAYITGNVASNLVGRLVSAWTAGLFGAPTAFLVFAGLNLFGAALAFSTIRPTGRAVGMAMPMGSFKGAIAPRLLAGYAVGFCILFSFIGIFSYVNFVLMRPPLGLGMMGLGAVYFVFAPSILATPLAGSAAARFGGRAAVLGGLAVAAAGLLLLAAAEVRFVIAGLVLVGLGTFFAQATATGQVNRSAGPARSTASGLYLTAYFSGGLAGAAVLGFAFETWGWNACLWIVAAMLAICAVLGLSFDGKPKTTMAPPPSAVESI